MVPTFPLLNSSILQVLRNKWMPSDTCQWMKNTWRVNSIIGRPFIIEQCLGISQSTFEGETFRSVSYAGRHCHQQNNNQTMKSPPQGWCLPASKFDRKWSKRQYCSNARVIFCPVHAHDLSEGYYYFWIIALYPLGESYVKAETYLN